MNTSTNEQIRIALNVAKAIMFSDEMVEAVPGIHTEDEIRTAGMAIRTAAGVLSDLQHLLEMTGTLEGAAAEMGQARLFDRTAEARGADVAEMLFGPRLQDIIAILDRQAPQFETGTGTMETTTTTEETL